MKIKLLALIFLPACTPVKEEPRQYPDYDYTVECIDGVVWLVSESSQVELAAECDE